jgi:hypothetical protein
MRAASSHVQALRCFRFCVLFDNKHGVDCLAPRWEYALPRAGFEVKSHGGRVFCPARRQAHAANTACAFFDGVFPGAARISMLNAATEPRKFHSGAPIIIVDSKNRHQTNSSDSLAYTLSLALRIS